MIRRWLVRKREQAAEDWRWDRQCAALLNGIPIGRHAEAAAIRSRRRLRRWDALLDLWTANGTS